MTMNHREKNTDKVTIFYNGGCSICAPEVRYYERLAVNAGLHHLKFEDVSIDVARGIKSLDYLKRFHVEHDQTLYSGTDAFVILWRLLPRFKYLAAFVSLPVINTVAKIIYDHVLAPLLFKRYLRQQTRKSISSL